MIKLYKDEDGTLKGDAIISYFLPDSVPLAIQLFDAADFRYKHLVRVSEVSSPLLAWPVGLTPPSGQTKQEEEERKEGEEPGGNSTEEKEDPV